ncbi:hypothetical protein ACP4OV_010332 [Aristida adscensionis]
MAGVTTGQPEALPHGGVSPPAPAGKKGKLLRLNSPLAQVSLLGLICFCCPGMFNALSGLGGGGQLDDTTANNANTAIYACFAVFALLGGAAHNLLGPRLTLLLGAPTYALFAASFLHYNHRRSQAFPVAAGALLGAGAGLLWAAQGAVMVSYPPPSRRGSYVALFWCIFTLGSVLGGLLPFAVNYRRAAAAASVSDGTYVAFMAVMLAGAALTRLVLPARRIVRDDGSRAARVVAVSSPATEGAEILRLFTDWRMLLMLVPAWASPSSFFYAHQFSSRVNGGLFTLRTTGLNNVFYWGAQIVGAAGVGCFLDFGFSSRRKRGLVGVVVVGVVGTAIWGGGLANQLRYIKAGKNVMDNPIDFKDGHRYGSLFMIYFSFGLLDAVFQTLIYWIIGALADDSQILSRYVGFFKGVQSAGAAMGWQIYTKKMSLMSQLIVNWVLMTVSYPLLALLVFLAVKDEDNSVSSVEDGEDSKLSAPTSFH